MMRGVALVLAVQTLGGEAFRIFDNGTLVHPPPSWDPSCNVSALPAYRVTCTGRDCECLQMNKMPCCTHPIGTQQEGIFLTSLYLDVIIAVLVAGYALIYAYTALPRALRRIRRQKDGQSNPTRRKIIVLLPTVAGVLVGCGTLCFAIGICDPFYLTDKAFQTRFGEELTFHIFACCASLSFGCLTLSISRLTKTNLFDSHVITTDTIVVGLAVASLLAFLSFFPLSQHNMYGLSRALSATVAFISVLLFDGIMVQNVRKIRAMTGTDISKKNSKLREVITLNIRLAILFTGMFMVCLSTTLALWLAFLLYSDLSLGWWIVLRFVNRSSMCLCLFLVIRMIEFNKNSSCTTLFCGRIRIEYTTTSISKSVARLSAGGGGNTLHSTTEAATKQKSPTERRGGKSMMSRGENSLSMADMKETGKDDHVMATPPTASSTDHLVLATDDEGPESYDKEVHAIVEGA